MPVGAHVFKENRLGLWAIENASLTDKLRHVLPRARTPLPNLTDIFLPVGAPLAAKDVVRANNFFAHLYLVAHGTSAKALAAQGLSERNRLNIGALEFDLEGAAVQPDLPKLGAYATELVGEIRKTNPNLPVRLNVPPFKGYALPVALINRDPQLFVIAQAYYGNMDGRLSESDVKDDLLDHGIDEAKVKIHYAVMAGPDPNNRAVVLPGAAYKPLTEGSVYDDDLLIDSGLLPA